MKLSAKQLGVELREGTDDFLVHRRAGAVLALVSMASLAVVALYQMGALKHLPEPPPPRSRRGEGQRFGAGLPTLEHAGRGAGPGQLRGDPRSGGNGGANRAQTQPWIPLALAAKAGLDTLQAGRLTRKSWVNYRAFSLYSLVTATATFLTLPTVLPEAYIAWRKLVHG